MTKRQAQLLELLKFYTSQHGHSPSYTEIALALGLSSKSGIHRLILALEAQGKIKRLAFRHRTIKVIA